MDQWTNSSLYSYLVELHIINGSSPYHHIGVERREQVVAYL